jgi:hexosaminidase
MTAGDGEFSLSRLTRIVIRGDAVAALPVAEDLAGDLRPATGYPLAVVRGPARPGDIVVRLAAGAGGPDPSGEAYRLRVAPGGVEISAGTAHGLFDAVQTVRQLLPVWIESRGRQPGPWTMPAVEIADHPRYGFRGFMLDIARHYEPPSAVEQLIDELAAYKIDVLHLHLSDDQGLRVVIDGFPLLTAIGGQGSVGTGGRTMDPGGYWTQADYRSVVAYAAARFISVVPEIDSPGHDNAIIMSEYGDSSNPLLDGHPRAINCGATNPPVWDYTQDVGYSALCPDTPDTWTILATIIDQLSTMSSSPYHDLGGDEVPTSLLSHAQYAAFVDREAALVRAAGKSVMGWADIAGPGTHPPAGSVAEYWQPAAGSSPGTATAREAVAKHMKVVMAPADHTYLDQKYRSGGRGNIPPTLGQNWACPSGCDVDAAYDWDPGHLVSGVTDRSVIGLEGDMWGETVVDLADVQYMVFPRMLALAELSWSSERSRAHGSPAERDFMARLADEGARMLAAGENFYPSSEVHWHLAVAADAAGATRGERVSGVIATLASPGLPVGAITARIRWGDGRASVGSLSGTDPTPTHVNSLYAITGEHTYGRPGQYLASLLVSSPGRAPVSAALVISTG